MTVVVTKIGMAYHQVKEVEAEQHNHLPITVQCGKIHEYLGMTLDITKPGKVMILMTEYIVNTLDSLDIPTCTG